jgi:two-component system NtrC family sensor kinase
MAAALGLHFIGKGFYEEMQNKVTHDLNTSREVYDRAMSEVRNAVRIAADRHFIKTILSGGSWPAAKGDLLKMKEIESLDMVAMLDRNAKVIMAAGPTVAQGYHLDNAVIREMLRRKEPVYGNILMSREELLRFGKDLTERAHIRLIPTPMARKTSATEETSGLVIGAAAPVLDGKGRMLGAVFGARLLNRSTDIVDRTKDILYGENQYRGRNIGAVTIFQGDLRISTNVRDKAGRRMIGTRIAQNVGESVLGQGKPWIDRAFVVEDWYLTAYEPIRDITGRIIGILFVGILERPFTDLKGQVFVMFISILLLGTALALGLAYLLSGILHNPVRKLMEASACIGKGDLSYRVRIDSDDEFGELGRTFNLMADSIQERDEQIKLATQEKIKGTEKLATIGQLAAGVAHEINNPLGGILVYTHLLLEDTPPGDPRRGNLEKIARETERVRNTVRGLLEFARQTESKVEDADVNALILATLDLVNKHILFENIKLVKELDDDLPILAIDKDKIRQVLINVIMNAAEAMENRGGQLRVATRYAAPERQVEIKVSDTGCGISPENLRRVFEPFFTTKDVGRGVGLGLAISYGIVKKHGGSIDIQSRVDKGTTVTISLPVDAPGRAEEETDAPSR